MKKMNVFQLILSLSICLRISTGDCDASMFQCPYDSGKTFAAILTGFQSKYQCVPAETELQAVDLSNSRDSRP